MTLSDNVKAANDALQKDASAAATTKAFGQAATDWILAKDPATPPPTPTGPVEPPPPPPPPTTAVDPYRGLCLYDKGTLTANDPQKARDLAGCKYARCDWPSAGWVTKLKSYGISVLPIAAYSRGFAPVSHQLPTDMVGWSNAVRDAYMGAWQKPGCVELWNEPWLSEFVGTVNPTLYYSLVKVFCPIIWTADPACKIVVPMDTNGSGGVLWRKPILAADTQKILADSRIRPSTHNYCEGRTPDQVTSNPCSWDLDRWKCAYNDLKAHGHPNPQVWVTEWGWEVNEGTHYHGTVTEATQADYTVKAIGKMRSSGMVERAYCFYLQTGNAWSYNWLDLQNNPRDVCAKVKALT